MPLFEGILCFLFYSSLIPSLHVRRVFKGLVEVGENSDLYFLSPIYHPAKRRINFHPNTKVKVGAPQVFLYGDVLLFCSTVALLIFCAPTANSDCCWQVGTMDWRSS